MLKLLSILIGISLGFLNVSASAQAAGWETYVEFRDTVKPDTVPEALVRQGKITVQPWTVDEKTEMRGYVQKVFERAPGLFRVGASQGPIPLYRIDMGSSFGGHGALWFSYMNSNVVAHELAHVTDAEHKIVRSIEFRNLVEPRIKKLRAALLENGFEDYSSAEANERTDLSSAAGLPSVYAAATTQETLAEYVRASVMTPDFKPPAEIQEFLQRRVINATPEDDPSVALYRRGKAARLNNDYNTAYNQLSQAIERDADFAEAYIERGLTLAAINQRQKAIDDFSSALRLMSEYDWQLYVPYFERGKALATLGQYDEALEDLREAKRLSPGASGLDATLGRVKFMLDMQNKRK